ncbi:MAG: efflux RND transporter permease subunit [Desulfobacterales bacterium]
MRCPDYAIHSTISAAFGSAYVNDFIQGGRVKRVFVQADAPYRMLPEDLEKLYVRNVSGKMVPFSSLHGPLVFRVSQTGAFQRVSVHQYPGGSGTGEKLR